MARTARILKSLCLALVIWSFTSHYTHARSIADDWYSSTRCNERSLSSACRSYERCKATHRCARGDEDYEISAASLQSFTREYTGGQREQIALANDFEDWKSGTHHWRFPQRDDSNNRSNDQDSTLEPRSWIGWDTFSFPVIGSLELALGYLVFDSDQVQVRGDVQFQGIVATTQVGGTSVAVFNFMTVYLGAHVRVRFQGKRAIAILSRSSFIVDTELRVRPGTLGGFPGGGFLGSTMTFPDTSNNNRNGPGSPNVRVYVKTLSTWAKHVAEVQEIETSIALGQNLRGHFTLSYPTIASAGLSTTIPYDATALYVRRRLETAFPDIGEVNVERDDALEQLPQAGRLWRVTFLSAVGNVPQLQAHSHLSGRGSNVVTRTIIDGNELSGSFRLRFLKNVTRWLPHDIGAEKLREVLLADLPTLINARVMRTDAKNQCRQGSTLADQTASSSILPFDPNVDQGLYRPSEWQVPEEALLEVADSTKSLPAKRCRSGRGAAGGFVWKLQFWTREGNLASTTPTSSSMTNVAAPAALIVDFSQLEGLGATSEIVDSQCFSLAFGGAGASFVSPGGAGSSADSSFVAPAYVDKYVTDLLGGSGGAAGGKEPLDVFPVVQPAQGGAGAGALLLSAVNDIVIGPNAIITANGGNGSSAFTPGGGGSGGSILLLSEATVSHHGVLEAMGGHGGQELVAGHLGGGGGGSGGRIAIYAQSYSSWGEGRVQVSGGASSTLARSGSHGSVYVKVRTELAMRIDSSLGAAVTAKSLLVHGSERYSSGSSPSSSTSHSVSSNGPRFVFPEPKDATRISYFVRVGNLERGALASNRGALFGIHRTDAASDERMIAIALIDGNFVHEANVFDWPRDLFHDQVQVDRWYKVDVTINWQAQRYSIRLNDVVKVQGASFQGQSVAALSLHSFDAMSTWWDEIYVGNDYLLGFACPWINQVRDSGLENEEQSAVLTAKRPWRNLWTEALEKPRATTYHSMSHHESHLSRQEVYTYDHGGMGRFDGAPHRAFFNDIDEHKSEAMDESSYKEQETTDVFVVDESSEEMVSYGEFLTIEGLPLDKWIVEPLETGIEYEASLGGTSANTATPGAKVAPPPSVYWYSEVFDSTTGRGAIGACSSIDANEWRNEGLMLHFTNLTDPFGHRHVDDGSLLADRPKVLFNRLTKQFVMWMHVEKTSLTAINTMGLIGVAKSEYPNGPFTFVRSLYPDAAPLEAPGGQSINETYDQTVAIIASSSEQDAAFLLRTYYKTVEYWLPRPVMDPLWQSVQKPSDTNTGQTVTDFGLSYHRAFHHIGYDDPTDIYLQRWRMEDTPWEVICCSFTNTSQCVAVTQVPQRPGDVCPDGMKKKAIVGQAQTQSTNSTPTIVETRYKDPNDDANSAFLPSSSVPAYTSWGFQVQNTKTWRGTYFDALSTNITLYLFKRFAGERRRHEIEQDPTIELTYPNEEELTQNTIPINDTDILDELLGTLGVPVSAAFKSNYSSFDLAEIDRNSDGKITSYEISQLEEQKQLKTLTDELVDALIADFNVMKRDQVTILDANSDGLIEFDEFENWLGVDPNLVFDRFDLDKNGFLDENELTRSLWFRQMPRLDTVIFILDPSFDGRVYYERFRSLVLQAPDYIFQTYDVDKSITLSQFEVDLMIKDLGSAFARPAVLEALKTSADKSITKAEYAAWFSATTSLVDDGRNKLKVDNAVHGTGPDRLTGPLYVVERRRAKYVAISALTNDYLSTRGLVREVEGDFQGRDALVTFFALSEGLFGLGDAADTAVLGQEVKPYREFLASSALRSRASYWNGRHWEGRPSAPSVFTYGAQCFQAAGLDARVEDEETSGCLPCLSSSLDASNRANSCHSLSRDPMHCQPHKALDAYIKEFDQQVSIQLQYQQQAQFGPQGVQPHLSPCYNQSQAFPCDVHKVLDGTVADTLRNWTARESAQNLAWEKHPNNVGSSVKIRAHDSQLVSIGPTYIERFPLREREPLTITPDLDSVTTYKPDELDDVLGGGR